MDTLSVFGVFQRVVYRTSDTNTHTHKTQRAPETIALTDEDRNVADMVLICFIYGPDVRVIWF